jgi:hypothetical protein
VRSFHLTAGSSGSSRARLRFRRGVVVIALEYMSIEDSPIINARARARRHLGGGSAAGRHRGRRVRAAAKAHKGVLGGLRAIYTDAGSGSGGGRQAAARTPASTVVGRSGAASAAWAAVSSAPDAGSGSGGGRQAAARTPASTVSGRSGAASAAWAAASSARPSNRSLPHAPRGIGPSRRPQQACPVSSLPCLQALPVSRPLPCLQTLREASGLPRWRWPPAARQASRARRRWPAEAGRRSRSRRSRAALSVASLSSCTENPVYEAA